ncbi:MAG TPA: polyprenol monophosphomannose synthase [Thermoleophilaceae bacterium]|nr:polyprenol monophosphomannose synthase [Thermoleophilaceae bacterium]
MAGVWLILPTYNEAENIEAIVTAALPQLASTGLDHHVLVVDDGSPDGTGAIADRLAAADPRVEVLHRTSKDGIGPAYLAGFAHALARGADLLMEMDSDFSHDPSDIPRLVAAAERADLVLGSRYVPGGGVTDWGLGRRLISRGGSLYAKLLLSIPVDDLTGGFKCFRRTVLDTLDLSGVGTDGYGFQIEVTYRAIKAGFRVEEVPILFRDRRVGSSKMSWRIAVEAFWKVPLLRWRVRA